MKITIRTSATASPADPDDGLRTCGAGRRGRGRSPGCLRNRRIGANNVGLDARTSPDRGDTAAAPL